MIKKDVIIIGAGASGMMCAISSGKRGRSVLVLDHASKIGKKIRISGGGSCNFTNINTNHANYLSNNPHFCKSALSRFTPHDLIALLEKHGVKKEGTFIVLTDHGIFESGSLVIATGGMSYPQIGASGIGYSIAEKFGLRVTELKPALVPFIFSPVDKKIFSELSGISIEAAIKCNDMKFRGNLLFTHNGLSGPAILQVSSYWKEGDAIVIDLLPEIDIFSIFLAKKHCKSKVDIHNLLSEYLPTRFAKIWFAQNFGSSPVNQYNEKELRNIAHQIHNWKVIPRSTEDYRTAEVTLGGIDTDELSSKTMESKRVKGLYFTGEVIDVTGQLGGYNLHWAWASGFVAGQYA
jgi:predicted Rossmann fold flavoprotein